MNLQILFRFMLFLACWQVVAAQTKWSVSVGNGFTTYSVLDTNPTFNLREYWTYRKQALNFDAQYKPTTWAALTLSYHHNVLLSVNRPAPYRQALGLGIRIFPTSLHRMFPYVQGGVQAIGQLPFLSNTSFQFFGWGPKTAWGIQMRIAKRVTLELESSHHWLSALSSPLPSGTQTPIYSLYTARMGLANPFFSRQLPPRIPPRTPFSWANLEIPTRLDVGQEGIFALPNLESAQVSWDFGDGNQDQGEKVAHRFMVAGTYPILVKVSYPDTTFIQNLSLLVGHTSPSPALAENTQTLPPETANPTPNTEVLTNATASVAPNSNDQTSFNPFFVRPVPEPPILTIETKAFNSNQVSTKKITTKGHRKTANPTPIRHAPQTADPTARPTAPTITAPVTASPTPPANVAATSTRQSQNTRRSNNQSRRTPASTKPKTAVSPLAPPDLGNALLAPNVVAISDLTSPQVPPVSVLQPPPTSLQAPSTKPQTQPETANPTPVTATPPETTKSSTAPRWTPNASYRPCSPPRIVSFEHPASIFEGQAIAFDLKLEGSSPLQFLWDFGGGVRSTEAQPFYRFRAGTHYLTLAIQNGCGQDVFTKRINVLPNAVCQNIQQLDSIGFKKNQASLDATAQAALQANLETLRSCPALCISLVASKDKKTSIAVLNQRLTEISNEYVRQGLRADRIHSATVATEGSVCNGQSATSCQQVATIPLVCEK